MAGYLLEIFLTVFVFAFHVSSWTFPAVIRGFVGSFGYYFVRWDVP
jgi:hypothetical protein